MKAAVNAPQSRRCARFELTRPSRQRLDCGAFSTASGTRFMGRVGGEVEFLFSMERSFSLVNQELSGEVTAAAEIREPRPTSIRAIAPVR